MNPLEGASRRPSSPAGALGPSGLILARKPAGLTSFQALGPIKRALGTAKVGHAGTLDKFASGLLVVLAGSYSRLTEFVQAGLKEYRGLISFGSETSTLDPEGEVVATGPLPSREALESALPAFRGPVMQAPPVFSALHVGGKRAYERALAGEELEMAPREIRIHELELESFEGGRARIRVICSAGTYIRSLARDLGLACGSRAYLAELERLAIGPFRVEEAADPSAIDPGRDLRRLAVAEAAALGLGILRLDKADIPRFRNGMPLGGLSLRPWDREAGEASALAVFDPEGELLGVVESREGKLSYRLVLEAGA